MGSRCHRGHEVTDYTTRLAGRRWLLLYQGRVIGIYSDPVDARRGADLDRRQRMPKLRLTIEVDIPSQLTDEELEQLHGAIIDDPDPLNALLEKKFDLKVENID